MKVDAPTILVLDDDTERVLPRTISALQEHMPTADIRHYHWVSEVVALSKFDARELAPDVVLLDVVGMDYSPPEAIPAIHSQWPEVPVLILTKKREIDATVEYFRAGARGFLFKDALETEVDLAPYSRMPRWADKMWDAAIDQIQKAADEYQPRKRLFYDTRISGLVRKEAQGPDSILPQQVEFLERMQTLPEIEWLFPEPLLSTATPNPSYEMHFFRVASLRKQLIAAEVSEEIPEIAIPILEEVVPILYRDLFLRTAVPFERDEKPYIQAFYFDKLRSRIEGTLSSNQHDGKAAKPLVGRIEALQRLLRADVIRIGEVDYPSPMQTLLQLSERLESRLLPPSVGLVHGDLHFDNILADAGVPGRPFIRLIDPPGYLTGIDFAQDIGKLLMSSSGLYDLLDEGWLATGDLSEYAFHEESRTIEVPPLRSVEWQEVSGGGASTDRVRVLRRLVTDQHAEGYRRLGDWILDSLVPSFVDDDPDILTRSRILEGLHLCTVALVDGGRNPTKSASLYLAGTVRLAGLLSAPDF